MKIVSTLVVEFGRLLRFGITGTIATLVYAASTFVLVEGIRIPAITSAIVAYSAAAVISYLGHLYFSFAVVPDHRAFFWRFAVTVPLTFAMNVMITWLTVDVFGGSYKISVALVTVLIPGINYLYNRFWVFLPGIKRTDECIARSSHARDNTAEFS